MSGTNRVFIVDDDRDHAESIADLLDLRGYEVEIAVSGEAGIARFQECDFDIVLMDVRLPGIDGVEAFFELKKIRPDVRVMMMTGYSLERLVARAVEHGALGVMHKPFAVSDLLATLEGTRQSPPQPAETRDDERVEPTP
jgi:DNA-binding response OmpR family regulator